MTKSRRKLGTAKFAFKPRKIRVRVIGLGGGGSSIVSEMAQTMKNASFVVADTDTRVFRTARPPNFSGGKVGRVKIFQFGEKLAHGMGTGMNPDLARRAAEAEKDKIAKIFQGQDLCILVGCLGGGVCSGAGPVFAEIARQTFAPRNLGGQARSADTSEVGRQKTVPVTIGIFTLPFSFEGEKKMKTARKALAKLEEHLSGIIVIPNEKIFQLSNRKTPLRKSLSLLNQVFADWLDDLLNLILKPNLINIDFADLRAVMRERGKVLFFGRAVAGGANRVEEVLKQLFENPLSPCPGGPNALAGPTPGPTRGSAVGPAAGGRPTPSRGLATAGPAVGPTRGSSPYGPSRILFNIAGGKDLKIKEVETISQAIAVLNPRAKIIFGISQLPQYRGKIKVCLLAVSPFFKRSSAGEVRDVLSRHPKESPAVRSAALRSRGAPRHGPRRAPTSRPSGQAKAGPRQGPTRPRAALITKTRRTAMEIKKAKEKQEAEDLAPEPEWQVPTFLRRKLKE